MAFDTQVRGRTQLIEWQLLIKKDPTSVGESTSQVIKDYTLQYDPSVAISNPKDLVTKEYVDALGGGGTGVLGTPTDGTFTDGLLTLTPSTKISDAADEINEFLMEIAPADAGALDGKILSLKSGAQKFTGFLSANPSATYNNGEGPGTQVNYIIKSGTFILESPEPTLRFNKGDQGVLELLINDVVVDSFDLAAKFDESLRSTFQTYTELGGGQQSDYTSANGCIIINDVRKYNNFKKWQKCIVKISINPSLLREGFNTFKLSHTGIATVQSTDNLNLFFDTDTTTPIISDVTFSMDAPTSSKYLSGLRYFSLGDAMKFSVTGTNLFKNVYSDTPITYSGFPGVANGSVSITDSSVTGLTSPITITDIFTVTNKALTITLPNKCSKDAKLTITPADPYGTYSSLVGNGVKFLISTFPDGTAGASTNTSEFFSDEFYRLPLTHDFEDKIGGYTSRWDSQLQLQNGNAQCFILMENIHALCYPLTDFRTYLANTTFNVDYTNFINDQQYARAFISPNSKTNAVIQLGNIPNGMGILGTNDVNLEIKLPTQTAWLDCCKPYSSIDGVNNNGNGCLNGTITYSNGVASIPITFGGRATVDSNYRMYVRVTLKTSAKAITSMIVTGW